MNDDDCALLRELVTEMRALRLELAAQRPAPVVPTAAAPTGYPIHLVVAGHETWCTRVGVTAGQSGAGSYSVLTFPAAGDDPLIGGVPVRPPTNPPPPSLSTAALPPAATSEGAP